MKTIDLSKYVTTRSRGYYRNTEIVLAGFQSGQRVARDIEVKKLAGEEVCFEVPFSFTMADDKFLSGLLRPLIRKQGMDETIQLVTATHGAMKDSLSNFFVAERTRVRVAAEKKAKAAGKGEWSAPAQFFVPEIGTIVRLTKDWTFRLHAESRNYDLFRSVGLDYTVNQSLSPAWGRHRGSVQPTEVTFKAGTKLKIDRIYIRKGVKNYSSITFNIVKGKDSVMTAGKLEHVFKTKGARFWAKLSDVNKMVVEVDQSTLAEN